MRGWGRGVLRHLADVPRPTDDPRAHASGVDADRVLLFGAGPSVGWGVLSHDMALPGSLARAVSNLTGRGTDVDVRAEPDLRIDSAIRELRSVDLTRYDAIVLTLGLNEAVRLTSISAWKRDLDDLLSYLGDSAPTPTPIFVVGIHATTQITRYDRMVAPIIAHHRRAMNRVSAGLSAHRDGVSFISFDPPPRTQKTRYRSTADYREGGISLAARIAPVLDTIRRSETGRRSLSAPLDTLARRNALDDLALGQSDEEQGFDRLTQFARRSFHAPIAKITIIEGERFWTKSSQGVRPTAGRRDDSICFTAIEQEDSLVVSDASIDPRFGAMAHIQGPPSVRFYAGHRIEAPNGVPIGVLSVQDSVARDVSDFDRALLRDLALLVQKEVWRLAQAEGSVGSTRRQAPAVVTTARARTFAPVAPPP
jgi:GAF domain